MLVHLGGDVSVLQKKIVAVLELNGELTEDTQDFIKISREEGFLIEIGPPPYKCGILTADKRGYVFYLSPHNRADHYSAGGNVMLRKQY